MEIETVSDLAEKMADWLGIYGCCDSNGCMDSSDLYANKPACCRSWFVDNMTERIHKSVDNDCKINTAGL